MNKKKKTKSFTLLSGNERGCYWTIILSVKENGRLRKKSAIQLQCIEDRNYQLEEARKYYLANRKWILKQRKEYRESEKGKEAEKLIVKKYRKTEKGKKAIRKASKKYSESEQGKKSTSKSVKRYSKTKKGKETQHRKDAKRRNLDFIELNEEFEGSEAHHIDKEFVLHIPKELHHSVWHNVWTGQGMKEINDLAFEFAYGINSHDNDLKGGKVKTI